MKKYDDGGQALLEAFRTLVVDYVFTASGSEWAPYWETVARQKVEGTDGPVYLDLWHETVAVAMATGYALVTGRVQAVLLHAGPGLLQGSCAIHGALLANVPMIVASSESITYGERTGVDPGSQWYRNLSVVGGPNTFAAPWVKWSNQVPSIETLYEMVVRAGEIAMRSQQGPVYLNIPVEVLLQDWQPPARKRIAPPPGRKASPDDDIALLVDAILAARAPVVLSETAGRDPAAFRALTALCDLMAIPVVEPQSAVCSNFPRRHPMHQGGDQASFVTPDTDLVLLVNCRSPWYPPSNSPPNAKIIVIDETPLRPHIVYQVLQADAYIEGNVAATLEAAVARLSQSAVDKPAIEDRRKRYTVAHDAQLERIAAAERKAPSTGAGIDPAYVVALLRDATSSDAIFVDETITHGRLLQQNLLLDEPSRFFYCQGGLGQGLGQALGVKLAAGRERLVILTIGDGSFLYNPVLPSLAAARDLGLPILVVIFNNQKYRSMQLNHLRFYPDGVAASRNDFYGVDLATQPDLARFAEPFGMWGQTVDEADRLPGALAEALAAVAGGTTAILNVMVVR